MNWYAAHYEGDPAAANAFGREALAPRRDALLQAWLDAGGGVADFVALRQAQGKKIQKPS